MKIMITIAYKAAVIVNRQVCQYGAFLPSIGNPGRERADEHARQEWDFM
jgi:hypothetical protein